MKFRSIPRCVAALVLAAVCLLSLGGCVPAPDSGLEPLSVTLLKVGKADAIVALSGSRALLIDTGEQEDGAEIVEFLRRHGSPQVEAMIITHFDRDHVGGAATVLEEWPVQCVCVPDYQGTRPEYGDFLRAAEAAGVPIQPLTDTLTFPFGDAQVRIDPPADCEISDPEKIPDNDFSLITTLVHGENRLVFTGDAEKRRTREWLAGDSALDCDFLKMPHHGVYHGALDELLEALQPEYAAICDSDKHPAEQKTLELLQRCCPHIYETRNGDIEVISDGHTLKIRQ